MDLSNLGIPGLVAVTVDLLRLAAAALLPPAAAAVLWFVMR